MSRVANQLCIYSWIVRALEVQEADIMPEDTVNNDDASEGEATEDEQEDEKSGDADSDAEAVGEAAGVFQAKWRTSSQRKPYIEALHEWLDTKYDSPECQDWNLTKEWLLSDKEIIRMARDPRLTTTEALASLQPPWIHAARWGEQVLDVLAGVTATLEARKREKEEEKAQLRAARVHAAEEARKQKDADQKQCLEESQSTIQPPPLKRLSTNATEEEKLSRKEELRVRRNAKARAKYHANKHTPAAGEHGTGPPSPSLNQHPIASSSTKPYPQLSTIRFDSPSTSTALSSSVSRHSTSGPENFVTTFQAKQEVVDNHDQLLGYHSNNIHPDTPSSSHSLPPTLPTPHTPAFPAQLQFTQVGDAEILRMYQQPTPRSRAKRKATEDLPESLPLDTPSVPRVKRRPKMKSVQPANETDQDPPQ